MSETTMLVLAGILVAFTIGGNLLIIRYRRRTIKAIVTCLLGDKAIGRQDMTIQRWRQTKKLRGPALERLLQDYLVAPDPTRHIRIEKLQGVGGGRGRRMIIPIQQKASDAPSCLILQARW